MHSFLLRVITSLFIMDRCKLLRHNLLTNTFNEALKYNKNHQCEFIIISRYTGKLTIMPVEPMLFLHGINSYETVNGQIILDLIAYQRKKPYNNLYFREITNNHLGLTTEVRRYTINIENNDAQYQIMAQDTIEFPFINPSLKIKNTAMFLLLIVMNPDRMTF